MTKRLMLAAVLCFTPAVAAAQAGHGAPVCDGTEMKRLEDRRRAGGVIAATAVASNLLVFLLSRGSTNPEGAPAAIDRGRRAMTFAFGTIPIIALGGYLHEGSYPDEAFWERALARLKVGETTTADVRTCLHAPPAFTSVGAEERWTYFMTRPGMWRSRRSYRSVTLTFNDGVLTEIRRSELNVPGGMLPRGH